MMQPALLRLSNSRAPQHPDHESELLDRCLAGDNHAWETFVREHTRRVYRQCYRFAGRHSEAEDLTQEVFLRVFRALGTFRRDEASIAGWLTRLTRNLLVDHYRATRSERLTLSLCDRSGFEHILINTAASPDRALARREARDLVRSILASLEPELRDPIVFRDLEEMNYREIALLVDIPVGTVKSRLHRARTELARITRRYRTAA
jgi:RNA polymerase sigma-70 factor, ECF subfamily